jgi:hypothetical protein
MSLSRIGYRTRQFWRMLRSSSAPVDLRGVQAFLGPQLTELFERMHPAEQEHSYRVYSTLLAQAESNPDLLMAALLHDAGKSRRPLSLPERVIIVLASKIVPGQVERWGSGVSPARGLLGAFQTAKQHPAWGAQMAAQAGASPLTCDLILHHQRKLHTGVARNRLEPLLIKLQNADDNH